MTVRIRALSGGRLDTRRSMIYAGESRDETVSLPVVCYLVEHPRGRLLYDTGIPRGCAEDPAGTLGTLMAKLFRVASPAGEDVVASLGALGLAPDDVTHVVNSHLHFDHCGCNACFVRARVLVQADEWQWASRPRAEGDDAPRAWDVPLAYERLEGEHDVFGDATVVAYPTPGHTPGHQSLKVRTARVREFVMTGDACYTQRHLDEDLLPARGAVWDERAMRESLAWLRRCGARSDVTLLYSHDDVQWRRLGEGAREIA